MSDTNPVTNYLGPTTTANSAAEGRLKVGVVGRKKKIIKKLLKKHHGKNRR